MNDDDIRPCPAAALEQTFGAILHTQMHGLPMVNPALKVEAIGFRPWREHWLGVLVTPWFMNLVLMPRIAAHWQAVAERDTRHQVFPAGVFAFIGGRADGLGDYQACSLFSPMFDFTDPQHAHDTAMAALAALFDSASREPGLAPDAADTPLPAAAPRPAPCPAPLSKRDFLFGRPS